MSGLPLLEAPEPSHRHSPCPLLNISERGHLRSVFWQFALVSHLNAPVVDLAFLGVVKVERQWASFLKFLVLRNKWALLRS